MSNIYEATSLQNKIQNNSHFTTCFKNNYYYSFCNKKNELNRIKQCYDNNIEYEKLIIEENYKKKSKENELNNNRDLNRKEIEYKKKQYSNEEEVKKKYYENLINNLKKKLENDKLKLECELNQINGDIFNLKKEIDELNIKNKEEIELKKNEKLYELKNIYEIKLIKYKNMKELEKKRKEKDLFIKQKEFEAQKEIEFNEMKNKSELVEKIIIMFKNISINS